MAKHNEKQPQNSTGEQRANDRRLTHKLIGWAMLAGAVVPTGVAIDNHIESIKAEAAADEAHLLGSQERSEQWSEIASVREESRNSSLIFAATVAGSGASLIALAAAEGSRGGARRRQNTGQRQEANAAPNEQPFPHEPPAEQPMPQVGEQQPPEQPPAQQ